MNNNKQKRISANRLPLLWLEANGVTEQCKMSFSLIESDKNRMLSSDRHSVYTFLCCFACELYLKFIIACDDWDKESSEVNIFYGHKLKELINNHMTEERRKQVVNKLIENKVIERPEEFDEHITTCNDGFEKLRYYFEFEPDTNDICKKEIVISQRFISGFVDVLSEISKDIFNEIKYNFEDNEVPIIVLDLN